MLQKEIFILNTIDIVTKINYNIYIVTERNKKGGVKIEK